MRQSIRRATLASVLPCLTVLLAGCSLLAPREPANTKLEPLTPQVVAANTSAGPLAFRSGTLLVDNDDAFDAKLAAVNSAQQTIDLAYYLYADDYSSSVFSQALLAATKRGVRVRLLLDYHGNYSRLDLFSMLEARSAGAVQVRFYNRPTRNIIEDAAYLTLACASQVNCAETKEAALAAAFAAEQAGLGDGQNANIARSGQFLSGLYGKDAGLMASAVIDGQAIDLDALKQGLGGEAVMDSADLKALAKAYWQANYGRGATRVFNRLRLRYALLVHGDELRPLHADVTGAVPLERHEKGDRAPLEWEHLTDFMHHKYLLVDGRYFVVGGRNVEDAYHMHANALSAKYTFIDADVQLELERGQGDAARLTQTFERLWGFETMVASLDEVRHHAPNDFLQANNAARALCASRPEAEQEGCHTAAVTRLIAQPRNARYDAQYTAMNERAATYRDQYRAPGGAQHAERAAQLSVDASAQVLYAENLPFVTQPDGALSQRLFGARSGLEREDGKHIHALWLSALVEACEQATEDSPRQVVIHNAYFYPSANVLSQLAQMVDGRQQCAGVEIVVLTNSIASTDLGIVNLFATHSVKALLDHYAAHHQPATGATLRYYEYVGRAREAEAPGGAGSLSLHTKVMLIDDEMFVGSANADVRSFMMDSNNSLLIRDAPMLVAGYRAEVEALLADPARVRRVDAELAGADHEALLNAGDRFIDALLSRYGGTREVSASQVESLKRYLRELSAEAWALSGEIVAHHGASREAQLRFDRLFKPI